MAYVAGAIRRHNLVRGKLRAVEPTPTPRGAVPERSGTGPRRARKGVGGLGRGRLRDVPTPRETVLWGEGPAVWISGEASEPREEMLEASLVGSMHDRGRCAPVVAMHISCE